MSLLFPTLPPFGAVPSTRALPCVAPIVEEECGPLLVQALGIHADCLSHLAHVSARSESDCTALRGLLQFLRTLHEALARAEQQASSSETRLRAVRGRADADLQAFRHTEDALSAQLREAHRMLAAERSARQYLEAERSQLVAQIEIARDDAWRTKHVVAGESQRYAEVAKGELEQVQNSRWKEWALNKQLEEKLATYQGLADQQGLVKEAHRRDANALNASEQELKQNRQTIDDLVRRAERAEGKEVVISKEAMRLRAGMDRVHEENQFLERILETAVQMYSTASGKEPRSLGSWKMPADAPGSEQRKVAALSAKAEAFFRQYVVLGHKVSPAVEYALAIAVGQNTAQSLLVDLHLNGGRDIRFPVESCEVRAAKGGFVPSLAISPTSALRP